MATTILKDLSLLTYDLHQKIQAELNEFSKKNVPVKWDRYTYFKMDKGLFQFNIYGWLPSHVYQADFLIIMLEINGNEIVGSQFTTSSVKYSKIIAKNIKVKHSPCNKWMPLCIGGN